ncbi:phage protein [Streptococcus uberis]|nr:phage protein [Streptococcus uberis]VEF32958.1 phage protein [Streptococcus urinalis]
MTELFKEIGMAVIWLLIGFLVGERSKENDK